MNKILHWLEEIRKIEIDNNTEMFRHEWINLILDEDVEDCSVEEVFPEKKYGKFFKIGKVM